MQFSRTHTNRDGLNFLLDFTIFRVDFDTHFNLNIVWEERRYFPRAGTDGDLESVVCAKGGKGLRVRTEMLSSKA